MHIKISKIIIKSFQQFRNLSIDLSNPKTGEALEKLCLIGSNGTGKSTLLKIFNSVIENIYINSNIIYHPNQFSGSSWPFIALKINTGGEFVFVIWPTLFSSSGLIYYKADVENSKMWQEFMNDHNNPTIPQDFCIEYLIGQCPLKAPTHGEDFVIYASSDGATKLQQDPPTTSLSNALNLFNSFPFAHSVSISNATAFWDLLIFLVKKRESDYQQFLRNPMNKRKILEEIELQFEKNNPEILPEIGKIWNRILEKAGLEFDVEGARVPIQLHENLQAYVKLKGTNQSLQYNQLSDGIRNYIFKLGHIHSLYFNRQIESGFLIIDEPENSLHPEMLYGLMEEYFSVVKNTQIFVATHSPIIAQQFESYERIHLEFDDEGFVTASTGIGPIGDDPNDLLIKDFQMRTVYGKQGLQKWERFHELQQLIRENSENSQKQNLVDEYLEIGNAYNFDPDEVP
jgi:energy-coupling factor transporter ATP-binding protein EcfA2